MKQTRRDHIRAAERHLEKADKIMAVDPSVSRCVAQAQAHASIATAHALLAQQAPESVPVQIGGAAVPLRPPPDKLRSLHPG